MCSTCGQRAAARLTPGTNPKNPIVIGTADGRAAQPVTFLKAYEGVKVGRPVFVTGDGVEGLVEDGTIRLGYQPIVRPRPTRAPRSSAPWYVQTRRNEWLGFQSRAAADRYALSIGANVLTREEVLGG